MMFNTLSATGGFFFAARKGEGIHIVNVFKLFVAN